MEQAPKPGVVTVTFDAGGKGSSVDSNPQWFVMKQDSTSATCSVEWHLKYSHNTSDEYEVAFGNIVPCHREDIPDGYDLESEPIPEAKSKLWKGWRWTLVRQPGKGYPLKEIQAMIEYEVFFAYGPKIRNLHPRSTVSLRQIFDVDPSLILPPKDSGGGVGGPPEGNDKD